MTDKPQVFKPLLAEATKVIDELSKSNPGMDRHDLSIKLSEQFPGLFDLSKELGHDIEFLAHAGASADMMAATASSKDQNETLQKLELLSGLHTSQHALVHRDGVRFGILLGLELGYILAKLYEKQSTKDDDFDKFMRGLGMEPPQGSVQ